MGNSISKFKKDLFSMVLVVMLGTLLLDKTGYPICDFFGCNILALKDVLISNFIITSIGLGLVKSLCEFILVIKNTNRDSWLRIQLEFKRYFVSSLLLIIGIISAVIYV